MDRTERERRNKNNAYKKKSRAKQKKNVKAARHCFENWLTYYRAVRPFRSVDSESVDKQISYLENTLARLNRNKSASACLKQLLESESPFLSKVPPSLSRLPSRSDLIEELEDRIEDLEGDIGGLEQRITELEERETNKTSEIA